MRYLVLKRLFAIAGFAVASATWAQMLPKPGEFSPSTINKERDAVTRPESSAPSKVARGPSEADAEAKVLVEAFVFSGNQSIDTKRLQKIVMSSVGQTVTFSDLEKVVDSITQYYRQQGFLTTRAYLPPQQIVSGVIQIEVAEGKLGNIVLKNESKISDARLRQMMELSLCPYQQVCQSRPLRTEEYNRGVLLLRDLPGTKIEVSPKAGKTPGTTDVVIEAKNGKDSFYGLSFDNYGMPGTGTTRLNASVDLNNFGGEARQLSLGISTTTTTNTRTGGVAYSFPIDVNGRRMGVAYARNQYRLGGEYKDTGAYGISNSASVFTTYPLIRDTNHSLFWRLTAEARNATNVVDSVNSFTKGSANIVRMGFDGESIDAWGGGGYNLYGLMFSQGYTRFNSPEMDRVTGRFGKIGFNLGRQQVLTGPMTVYADIRGQFANKKLEGAEQIGLGGPLSVRGYAGEAGGSTGASGIVEFRYTQPIRFMAEQASLTYGFFVDRGWVRYDESPTNFIKPNTRALSSYGLSLTLQSARRMVAENSISYFGRAVLARHSMDAASTSFVDPKESGKFWLQGGVNF